MSTTPSSQTPETGALYRAVWRLHFYAGVVVAPFAIFLAITGALYLWKPQFEEWHYREIFNVPIPANEPALSADEQFAAAREAFPPFRPVTFTPALAPGRSSQVEFNTPRGRLSAFINPYTGELTGTIDETTRPMNVLHDLHGELLAGPAGGYIVELAASWAFVLFLSGLYLWWPRPRFAVWGFLLPRLRAQGRIFWRDLHAVPAVWFSVMTLFLLTTGLLWSQASGKWYRTISAALGQGTPAETSAGAHRSELTGWSPPLRAGLAEEIDALASTPPAELDAHGSRAANLSTSDYEGPEEGALALDQVIAIAAERNVPQPYTIALPVGPTGVYSVISDRHQALSRTYLHLDQYSGKVLADVRFKDFGYLAQFFLWGIIAHEGRLFGLANQILGSIAAAGVLLLAVSGLVMWWQRRPAGSLSAPVSNSSLPKPVVWGTLALSAALPLLAASLAALLVFDRALFRFLRKPQPHAV
ncbi:MAG: PepSY domain-containing protein [Opitutus sp.]|nr:PepSY domain-containing protein [Opitutus sp.]